MQVALDIDASLAQDYIKFEETEREMRGVPLSSATQNESGYPLVEATLPVGDAKQKLANGKTAFLNTKNTASNENTLPVAGDQKPQRAARIGSNKEDEKTLSPQRSRQRPRATPTLQHLPKYDRLPASGHVSSIIGRFEQTRPEKPTEISASSNKRKSVERNPPSDNFTPKIVQGSKTRLT